MNKIKILNALYPIERLIGSSRTNVICPFHRDERPSAHVYENHLWCFSCRKSFYVVHFIRKQKLDAEKLYKELVEEYGDEEMLLEKFDKLKLETVKEPLKKEPEESEVDFIRRMFK